VVAKVTITDISTSPADYHFAPGTQDTTFGEAGLGFRGDVWALALQPDGKVIVGGNFSKYNGIDIISIARLNADGTLDTTFNQGGFGTDATIFDIVLQPDGKILIAGSFTQYNRVARSRIARLNADGTLDTTFSQTGSGLNDLVSVMVLQPDGKVLVGGQFTAYNGIARSRVARLNADGTLDTTFSQTGLGLHYHNSNNGGVRGIALQPDGRMIVGGGFDRYDTTPRHNLLRLNADGTLDATFTETGSGLQSFLFTVALQPDGKVLVGGNITEYNGISIGSVSRFNSDGTLDTTFTSGLHDVFVSVIVLQPDGKMLVSFGGSQSRVARLNPDGSLDTSFAVNVTGLPHMGRDIILQPDGKILVEGFYTDQNNSVFSRVVRLEGDIFVTWPAGDAADKTITLPIVDDSLHEANEALNLTVTPLTGGATGGSHTTQTLTIVDNDNSAPTANNLSVSTAEDTPVSITLTGSDADGDSLTYTILNAPAHGTLSGTAPNLTYTPASNYSGEDSFTFKVNDGRADSASAGAVSITVNAVNDAPVNSVPSAQTTTRNIPLTFSAAEGNAISVADVDAASSPVRVKLTATGGQITLSQLTGLVFTTGDGTSDATMTFSGAISSINAALDGLIFTPTVNFSGVGSLQITTNDLGNSGSGRALSDTDAVSITINRSTIVFNSSSYNATEAGGHATITVIRLGSRGGATSVNYLTSDASGLTNCNVFTGNASSRCDYTGVGGTLHFAPGQSSVTFTVPIIDDSYAEGEEILTLTLSNAVGGALGDQSSAILTIGNDDDSAGAPNPIDAAAFFTRQHYLDFLGREPDPLSAGWIDQLNQCVPADQSCRLAVSQGIYASPEFRERVYFIYKIYALALGRKPTYAEFAQDRARVSGFLTDAELEQRKLDFIVDFMSRQEFRAIYDAQTNARDFVETMLATGGLTFPAKENLISRLDNGTITRAQALREMAESAEANAHYETEATVVMHYFGYLRRDPDGFYLDWINILNQSGDSRTVTAGFINSAEYRMRFGR
jgi:uncharacterized delta-60 repeat protein